MTEMSQWAHYSSSLHTNLDPNQMKCLHLDELTIQFIKTTHCLCKFVTWIKARKDMRIHAIHMTTPCVPDDKLPSKHACASFCYDLHNLYWGHTDFPGSESNVISVWHVLGSQTMTPLQETHDIGALNASSTQNFTTLIIINKDT